MCGSKPRNEAPSASLPSTRTGRRPCPRSARLFHPWAPRRRRRSLRSTYSGSRVTKRWWRRWSRSASEPCNASRSRRRHRTRPYNQKGTGDTAKAKSYGGDVSYDMVRNGDAGVTVTIRIQFLNQTRNTVPKTAASPATDPELGDLIGKPTEIPANDPDKRRDWCQQHRQRAGQALERQADPGRRGGQRHRRKNTPEAAAGDLQLGRGLRPGREARPADHRPPERRRRPMRRGQPDRRGQLLPEQGRLRRRRQRDRRARVRAPAGHRRRVQPEQRDAQRPAAPCRPEERAECQGCPGQEDDRADGHVLAQAAADRPAEVDGAARWPTPSVPNGPL